MFEAWLTSNWKKRGLLAWSLLPLSWLYAGITWVRHSLYQTDLCKQYRASVPVVVVGNIYVGGTGKTPVILSLITALQARGWHPGLVSRGYGSSRKTIPACGVGTLDAAIFGDEPAMISRQTQIPISVHPNRAAACQALLQFDSDIDVILSDDGLQHWRLARDVEILVQDERACGNGFVLPAGPLRESSKRLKSVDAVLTRTLPAHFCATTHQTSIPQHHQFAVQVHHFIHLQSGTAYKATDFAEILLNPTPGQLTATNPTQPVLAMAGIGVPERFFQDLRTLGIPLSRSLPLPDHGAIAPDWIAQLPERTILMTEKDAVRLIQAYFDKDDATMAQATASQTPFSSNSSQLHCSHADHRIWVGVAKTLWQDESLFDWLDQRLRQLLGNTV